PQAARLRLLDVRGRQTRVVLRGYLWPRQLDTIDPSRATKHESGKLLPVRVTGAPGGKHVFQKRLRASRKRINQTLVVVPHLSIEEYDSLRCVIGATQPRYRLTKCEPDRGQPAHIPGEQLREQLVGFVDIVV